MEKMKMHTPDGTDVNIKKIAELFPNCLTEKIGEDGHLHQCIDFDVLRQELSKEIVEGPQERYHFTWPDKKKAIRLANAPTTMTLRPCRDESVNFDTTENLYIEGDNLEVLKLLREDYLGKVKMIYIDPPYNTGNDFVYEDDFSQTVEDYFGNSGQSDTEGNRLVQNTESNGRFHTDWLNMMYPRLRIAKDLLSQDGVIFISIDDHEVENLKKICNEIFGAQNFEGQIHWRRRHNQPNDKTKMIGIVAEHIIVFAKNSICLKSVGVGKLDLTATFTNPDNDPKGPWASKPWKVGSDQSGSVYDIIAPNGQILKGPWMGDKSTYEQFLAEGRIYFPKDGAGMPRKKYYQFEREEEGQCATNWWTHEQFGHNQGANDYATSLFGKKNIFSNPKPIELIRGLAKIGNVKGDDIVLDFFSGSATTADVILRLNAEDKGRRRFIMVQIPEITDSKSEAYKAGYKNICEIGKERIRRAGNKIKEAIHTECDSLQSQIKRMAVATPSSVAELFGPSELKAMYEKAFKENAQPLKEKLDEMEEILLRLDTGFRVLKLDSSNMEDVYYRPEDSSETTLFEDNVKTDRTGEDLLFQVMLECNLPLSAKIQTEKIAGKEVFSVNNGYLIACFDEDVNEVVITAVAKRKPYYFIMRDKSLSSDNVADNFEQIFQAYSKETIRRIL